jgi:hypothetical protein
MKKRARRSISVALWLVALLVATGIHAAPLALARLPGLAAVANPVIRFDPSSSTVEPGAVFVVSVVVDNVMDLGGYEFTVTFNSAVVHVQSVALGPFLGSTGNTVVPLGPAIDNTAGSFTFGGFTLPPRAAPGPTGTGTVAQVTLQAMAAGSSALTFTRAQLTDTQATVLGPLTMTPGSVTVSGPTATPTPTRTPTSTPVATPTVTPTPPSRRYWLYLPLLIKRASQPQGHLPHPGVLAWR